MKIFVSFLLSIWLLVFSLPLQATDDKLPLPQKHLISPINIFMIASGFVHASYKALNNWYSSGQVEHNTYYWRRPSREEADTFLEHEIDGSEADCAFIALGIERLQAIRTLVLNAQNADIRRLVAPDLLAIIIDPTDPHELPNTLRPLREVFRDRYNQLQNEIENIRQEINRGRTDQLNQEETLEVLHEHNHHDYNEYQKALREFKEIETKREQYDRSITAEQFISFIEFQFGERHGYLSYMYGGGGTLEALARLLDVNVQIFITNEQHQLTPTLTVEVDNPRNTFYLLHTGNKNANGRLELNHFNLLQLTSPETITNTRDASRGSEKSKVRSEIITNTKEVNTSSNQSEYPWHEDALPTGHLVLPMIFEGVDETNHDKMIMRFKSEQDQQTFYMQIIEMLHNDHPDLTLKIIKKYNFSSTEVSKLQSKMLKELANKATLQGRSDISASYDQHANKLKEKDKERQDNFEQKKTEYYRLAHSIFSHNLSPTTREKFLKQFYILCELKPNSIEPYLPLITFMSGMLPDKKLETFLYKAHSIDPHLTYVYCILHLRLRSAAAGAAKYLFRCSNPAKIIPSLKKLYPEDAFINSLSKPSSSDCQFAFSTSKMEKSLIATNKILQSAWIALVNGQTQAAINSFVKAESSIFGFAFIYRYLTLAWLMEGDIQKALHLYKRAKQLPNIPHDPTVEAWRDLRTYWQALAEITDFELLPPPILDDQQSKADPLHKLLTLALLLTKRGPQDKTTLSSYRDFIETAIKALSNKELDQLPFIYLGFRWMYSRFLPPPPDNDFEIYRPLFNSLTELMFLTACLCFEFNPVDPWIDETFKKQNDGMEMKISLSFEDMFYTASPNIIFEGTSLQLSSSSIQSLSTQLTRDIYSFILGLMCYHTLDISCWTNISNIPVPDSASIFLHLLNQGLRKGADRGGSTTPQYLGAAHLLDRYLTQHPRPYDVNSRILEWGKFVVSSVGWPEDEARSAPKFLESAISRDNKREHIVSQLKKGWRTSGEVTHKTLLPPSLQAIDQVLTAVERINRRSNVSTRPTIPTDNANIYDIFQVAEDLFGWRHDESFEAWGQRLLQKDAYTCFDGSRCYLEFSFSREDAIEIPIKSKKVREILKHIKASWQQFHEKTTRKNAHIAQGGDENEDGVSPVIRRQDDNKEEDKGAEHHAYQVKELTEHFNTARKIVKSPNDLIVLFAATLLTNLYEGKREDVYYSIVVDTRESAEKIYRILLDIAVDQLVRQTLVKQGADTFMLTNTRATIQLFDEIFRYLLEKPKFHGPERHNTGTAPRQTHYNAGVLSGILPLINVHIYYLKE